MYLDLRTDEIDRNPGQPRKHFDEEKLRELAESIAANGLLEPVVVRPVGDRYLLIAGERRWRASQRAGLEVIPARVMHGLDDAEAYVLSVAENVNRDDMTVMEEARAYAQLRAYGRDVDEVARVFGKRVSTVRERLALVDLDDRTQALIDQGVVGPVLGYRLSFLEPGNQRVVVQRLTRGEIDHQEALVLADALYEAQQETGFFDMAEPTVEEREQHAARARRARSQADQVGRLSALLAEIADSDPADLAAALGTDVGARLAMLDDVVRLAGRARGTMRKAKVHAEARALVVSEEAQA